MRIISTVCIALVAFALGVLSYHPAASAFGRLALIVCSSTASCTGGDNKSTGAGVLGYSVQGYGIEGETQSISSSGVYGKEPSAIGAGNGVFGVTSNHGAGVYGQALGQYGSGLYASAPNGGSNLIQSMGGSPTFGQFWVDNGANVHTTGLIYTAGNCKTGCERRAEQSYAISAASPSLEDTGEAQLSFGSAYVRLRPDFANTIDPSKAYVVFLTPEGDTRGLFVTQRSATAFAVRETLGGRSSIAFAYRVVAQPYGVNAPRLPFVARQTPIR